MVHVAYKGSAAYVNDLIGGQVPGSRSTPIADLTELHRAGRIQHPRELRRDALVGAA